MKAEDVEIGMEVVVTADENGLLNQTCVVEQVHYNSMFYISNNGHSYIFDCSKFEPVHNNKEIDLESCDEELSAKQLLDRMESTMNTFFNKIESMSTRTEKAVRENTAALIDVGLAVKRLEDK